MKKLLVLTIAALVMGAKSQTGDCWTKCGSKSGLCPQFCGAKKACCKQGFPGQPVECDGASFGCGSRMHCCSTINKAQQDCWGKCGSKSGMCPQFCGAGKACCKEGFPGQPTECSGATFACGSRKHCCAKVNKAQQDCWGKCGSKSGNCPQFCGAGMACCKEGFPGQASECSGATFACGSKKHCCAKINKDKQDCWGKCGSKSGNCPQFCGAGKACCKEGFPGQPKECDGAKYGCGTQRHCCSQKKAIDGNWGAWTKDGACSKSCGAGTQKLTRKCDNPPAQFGGKPCIGNLNAKSEPCNLKECPVDGIWSAWKKVGACTKSCGSGVQSFERTCTPPKFGGKPCAGNNKKTEPCNTNLCATYTWNRWTPCSATCFPGGTRTRTSKTCRYPSGAGCPQRTETGKCNTEKCEYCSKKLEAGVILDRSGSVAANSSPPEKNWQLSLDFVKDFLTAFDISEFNVHYGIMRFSTGVDIDVNIKDPNYWDNKKIVTKITDPSIYNQVPSGGTAMSVAFNKAMANWFCTTCTLRGGVPRVVLIFTDGRPNNVPLTYAAADALKKSGVTVIAVGIGSGVDTNVLNRISTDPTKHVFSVNGGFNYLRERINQMVKATCEPAAPKTP